jgi:hypothetical protein
MSVCDDATDPSQSSGTGSERLPVATVGPPLEHCGGPLPDPSAFAGSWLDLDAFLGPPLPSTSQEP